MTASSYLFCSQAASSASLLLKPWDFSVSRSQLLAPARAAPRWPKGFGQGQWLGSGLELGLELGLGQG